MISLANHREEKLSPTLFSSGETVIIIESKDFPLIVFSNTKVSKESQYGMCYLSFLLSIWIHFPNVINDELIEIVSLNYFLLNVLLLLTLSEPAKSTISRELCQLAVCKIIQKIAWLLDDLKFILVFVLFLFLIIIHRIFSKSAIFYISILFRPSILCPLLTFFKTFSWSKISNTFY